MLRIANLSSTGMCKKLHQKRNCNTRTDFLARMREHLVVTALQKQTDLIGMCDIDFRHFNETAFLELCSSCVPVSKQMEYLVLVSVDRRRRIYDTGSIEPQSAMRSMTGKHIRPVRVRSAFSGFGIYRADSIRMLNASYLAPFPSHVRSDQSRMGKMEHIRFNWRLRTLYVDPQGFRPLF